MGTSGLYAKTWGSGSGHVTVLLFIVCYCIPQGETSPMKTTWYCPLDLVGQCNLRYAWITRFWWQWEVCARVRVMHVFYWIILFLSSSVYCVGGGRGRSDIQCSGEATAWRPQQCNSENTYHYTMHRNYSIITPYILTRYLCKSVLSW